MIRQEIINIRNKLSTAVHGIPVRISKRITHRGPGSVVLQMYKPYAVGRAITTIDSVGIDDEYWRIEGFVCDGAQFASTLFPVFEPKLEDVRVFLVAKLKPNMDTAINLGYYTITNRERVGDYQFDAIIGEKVSD